LQREQVDFAEAEKPRQGCHLCSTVNPKEYFLFFGGAAFDVVSPWNGEGSPNFCQKSARTFRAAEKQKLDGGCVLFYKYNTP
jgi:hypothetical protein